MSEYQIDSAQAQEAARLADVSAKATEGLKEAMASGRIMTEPSVGLRTFLSPTEPNTQFLVRPGKLISFPDPNSPTGRRDSHRDGDIWATFSGGVCVSRDPIIIEWLEAHAGDRDAWLAYHARYGSNPREDSVPYNLCRDIRTENVEAWAEMKALQVPTSRRAATLSPGLDVDKVFGSGRGVMNRDGNSAGQALVAAGEATAAAEEQRFARYD